jgi:hypothetical protein
MPTLLEVLCTCFAVGKLNGGVHTRRYDGALLRVGATVPHSPADTNGC